MTSRKKPTTKKRSYDDACGTAHALELIGERWAILVMRELMLGARRFGELRAALPGISANVLTQRLTELEGKRLVVRRKLPPPASVQIYELTEWGYEAESIVCQLGRWAARSPAHDPTAPISAVSVMLSFRTLYVPERARGFGGPVGFRFGDQEYIGEMRARDFRPRRGEAEGCPLWFEADPRGLVAWVHGGVPRREIERQGLLSVYGDEALADHFARCFELPPKAI